MDLSQLLVYIGAVIAVCACIIGVSFKAISWFTQRLIGSFEAVIQEMKNEVLKLASLEVENRIDIAALRAEHDAIQRSVRICQPKSHT